MSPKGQAEQPEPLKFPERPPPDRGDGPRPLTKAELLAYDERATVECELGPLGAVQLRAPTLADVLEFLEKSAVIADDDEAQTFETLKANVELGAVLVSRCLTDPESGELMFDQGEVEALFDRLKGPTTQRLIAAAVGLVEELCKGIQPDPTTATAKAKTATKPETPAPAPRTGKRRRSSGRS